MVDTKLNQDTLEEHLDHDQDYDFWLLLTRARQLIYRARELELLRYHLTPEQALFLAIVYNNNNKLTPSKIARLVDRRHHSVSSLLIRMEQKGLVKRNPDTSIKNLIRVELTDKGEKAYLLSSKRGPIHRILKVLDYQEKELTRLVLLKLTRAAEEELGLTRDPLPSSD